MHSLYVFDAYGTLFDVHSAVARHRGALGPDADRLSEIWRARQLEYTWTRSLMGAYRDFRALTEEALDYAIARTGPIGEELREALLAAYDSLAAYDDVAPCLRRLRAKGAQTAILSNGTPDMLDRAVIAAGLDELIDARLSVDAAGVYKTHPSAYALVGQRFGLAAGEISFQSSNRWDVAGAARYGFRTAWINRLGAPDEYADAPPDAVFASLEGLE